MKEHKKEINIKTMLGLGDAVYTFPIVQYYVESGFNVSVITRYPIVFNSLKCTAVQTSQKTIDIRPRYNHRNSGVSQYKGLLNSVNLPSLPFIFRWDMGFTDDFKNTYFELLLSGLNESRKKLCVVKEPCTAHMHKKQKDFSVSPGVPEIQGWLDSHREEYFFVSVGKDEVFKTRLNHINIDLNNKTTVQDLITLCSISQCIITQVGHLVPLAQGLSIPLKIFYPENPVDSRIKAINKQKMEIEKEVRGAL